MNSEERSFKGIGPDLPYLLFEISRIQFDEQTARLFIAIFGLEDDKPKALQTVSKEFGITPERIREIISGCLSRLRKYGNIHLQESVDGHEIERAELYGELLGCLREILWTGNFSLTENLDFIHTEQFSFLPKSTHYLPLVTALGFRDKSEEAQHKNELEDYRAIARAQALAERSPQIFESDLPYLLCEIVHSRFTERKARIFISRFGLEDGHPKTLRGVGKEHGISGERIRQIIAPCFPTLRHYGNVHLKGWGRGYKKEHAGLYAELFGSLRNIIANKDFSLSEKLDFIHAEQFSFLPKTSHFLPLITALVFKDKSEEPQHELESYKTTEDNQRRFKKRQKGWSKRLQSLLKSNWRPSLTGTNLYFSKARDPRSCPWAISGSFYSDLLQREVAYESELEHRFFVMLEGSGLVENYQEQPTTITYRWQGKRHLYYPDVFVSFKDGQKVLFEIKPVSHMALKRNLAKWEALQNYCRERGIQGSYTDGYKTLDQIKSIVPPAGYTKTLLQMIETRGVVRWADLFEIKQTYGANVTDLVSFVANNDIDFELSPFRLSAATHE